MGDRCGPQPSPGFTGTDNIVRQVGYIPKRKNITARREKNFLRLFISSNIINNICWVDDSGIRTDHAALQWLMKTPEPIGQQSRWVEQLAAFDFEVIHRPGKRHQNADSISRIPCRQCGWEGEKVDVVAPVKEDEQLDLSPDAMKDLQLKDPDIAEFV